MICIYAVTAFMTCLIHVKTSVMKSYYIATTFNYDNNV